jgi:DNA polymerase-3 subunit gamma/tau
MGLAGRRDLEYAPDTRGGFEMALIRMLAFRPASQMPVQQIGKMSPAQPPARTEDKSKIAVPDENPSVLQTGDANRAGQDKWHELIDEMALAGLVRELAGHCILKEHTQDHVHLVLSPAKEHLLNTAQKERLLAALQDRFGGKMKVQFSVANLDQETPADRKSREARERQLAAEQAVTNDPALKSLQDMFDATLDKNSIQVVK